jgi:hypothetical protein
LSLKQEEKVTYVNPTVLVWTKQPAGASPVVMCSIPDVADEVKAGAYPWQYCEHDLNVHLQFSQEAAARLAQELWRVANDITG